MAPPRKSWHNEPNYYILLENQEVKDLLARQAPPPKRMSQEAWAKITGGSFGKAATSAIHEVAVSLNLKTGTKTTETFHLGVGQVIVAILCSFARTGLKISEVRQASDGVVIIGVIPSGINNFEGDIFVGVKQNLHGVVVNGEARIAGQVFDSGICKRRLKQVFNDIRNCSV